MLVQNDVAPEKFAKENEGSIFQKADPMTGDRQISCIGTMNQKLPKDAQEGGQGIPPESGGHAARLNPTRQKFTAPTVRLGL